jgi:hypothetical protein
MELKKTKQNKIQCNKFKKTLLKILLTPIMNLSSSLKELNVLMITNLKLIP